MWDSSHPRRLVWEPNTCEVLGGGVCGAWDRFDGSMHQKCRFVTGWKLVKVDLALPMAASSSSFVSCWTSSTEASLKATVDLLLLHHAQPWLLEIIDLDLCVWVCERMREKERWGKLRKCSVLGFDFMLWCSWVLGVVGYCVWKIRTGKNSKRK